MSYKIYLPNKDLSKYVKFFWTIESDSEEYLHRSFADTCCEMIFIKQGDITAKDKNGTPITHQQTAVHTQTTNYSFYSSKNGLKIFGVYFYPYTINAFIHDDVSTLNNHFINIKDVLHNELNEITEKIFLSNSIYDSIEIISAFFQEKACKSEYSLYK